MIFSYEKYDERPIPERVVFGDFFDSQQVGLNHVPPIDNKRFPYLVTSANFDADHSVEVLRLLKDMGVSFKPWSSARYISGSVEDAPSGINWMRLGVVFYFTDQADASIFKIAWGSE